jgi:dipeptidyl aminopeptidase/acylaminoacyl peptidase
VEIAAMRLREHLALIVFVAALPLAAGAQNPPAPATAATPATLRNLTVDDYFRIKEVADAQISPEGKWVAYTVKTHRQKEDDTTGRIWMAPTAGGGAIAVTGEGSCSSHPRWSPDGKYLAFLREKGDCDGDKQVWIINREGGEPEQLTDTAQEVKDFAWSPESDRLVLVLQDPDAEEMEAAKRKRGEAAKHEEMPEPWVIDRLHFKEDEIGYLDHRRTHLYVFTMADRKLTQITSGDYDDIDPAWSPDERSVAFTSNRSENPDSNYNTNIWVVAAENADKGKSLVRVSANPGTDSSPTWSPDGKWLAFTSQLEPRLIERATIHLAVAPATGGEAKILTWALDRSVYAPRFSRDGKYVYFLAEDDGTQNLLRISPGGGEITRPIAGRQKVDSFSINESGAIAAIVGELARPDEVYFLPAYGDLRRLTTANDAVMSQIRLGSAEYVHFKSKDGTAVAGYIFEPPDFAPGKKSPAILWLHGGPVMEYFAEFDFRAWILAANGYVVVMPNPRGSSGYGQEFCAATNADWGNKDYEDDMAAMDYAIEQGLADADKLGVGGHSYGAISTNWIITKTSRFKAAISNGGEFLNTSNYGDDEYSRDWEIELGLPWENRALWEKLSPFNSVTKIRTPTLVIGGDEDWNCPIINGEQLYQSLRRLGVPTLLVVYPGEAHEFERPSFVKDYYERYLFWYGHCVKGEGPASPPPAKPAR